MREKGAVRAEVMPGDLCRRILEEEATVTGAMGSMPVKNSGLDECLRRNTVICVFEDETFWTPLEGTPTMDMLAVPYYGSTGWIPKETGCVIWFPSPTSNTIIHKHYGQPLGELATAMVALNL